MLIVVTGKQRPINTPIPQGGGQHQRFQTQRYCMPHVEVSRAHTELDRLSDADVREPWPIPRGSDIRKASSSLGVRLAIANISWQASRLFCAHCAM